VIAAGLHRSEMVDSPTIERMGCNAAPRRNIPVESLETVKLPIGFSVARILLGAKLRGWVSVAWMLAGAVVIHLDWQLGFVLNYDARVAGVCGAAPDDSACSARAEPERGDPPVGSSGVLEEFSWSYGLRGAGAELRRTVSSRLTGSGCLHRRGA
jgi:hypothetical protein